MCGRSTRRDTGIANPGFFSTMHTDFAVRLDGARHLDFHDRLGLDTALLADHQDDLMLAFLLGRKLCVVRIS